MANSPFSINAAQGYKEWNDWGHVTPNFEFSEGQRPAGEFQTAKYFLKVKLLLSMEQDMSFLPALDFKPLLTKLHLMEQLTLLQAL